MAALSREAARVLVGKIREENGGISPEDRAASPPAVLRALENVRRKLGAATKTLATSLYSKDTRFVYELIQNAEDNKYTRAEAEGLELYLSFSMYPDRIVLDSNEDGFAAEHVRAICSTGESTKTVAQGYIGEKGIGFKSVFKVAKKVHIQSGPFSFAFEHTRDYSDDGLGMVTPLDEDYEDLPEHVHTRITLILLDPSTFEQRVQDLLNIPDTLLLFLSKLNVLHVNIFPHDQSATEIEYAHFRDDKDNFEVITKTTTIDNKPTKKAQYFHVTRKEIYNLPRDEARKNINQATVVLAFPLDEEDEPIIEQQHAFAFLPLRRAGFTFLIQSDFVTQASREDVFHSTRNEVLLSGVAETFQDAVLQFCKHHSLQYQWMRYLPSDSISDEFWKKLRPKVIALLSHTYCLRSWSENSLHLPKSLYRVQEYIKDAWGQPLLADLAEEAYLSPHYTLEDIELLKPLGTRDISYPQMISRLRSDIGRDDSKMKAIATDEDWHTQMAQLLLKLSKTSPSYKHLKSLELIPLQDSSWVSAKDSPVFLPHTGGHPIPTDLGLRLIQPAAISNTTRKSLFLHLGAEEADPDTVIDLIIGMYYPSGPMYNIDAHISHLRYLYWNLLQDDAAPNKDIYLIHQSMNRVHRTGQFMKYIYFKDEEEQEQKEPCESQEGSYRPQRLLQSAPPENPAAPGLSVQFLNPKYLYAVPTDAVHNGRSWKLWLNEYLGVHNYVQLLHPQLPRMSDEFKYIIRYRSEKLVGLLKYYWSFYESKMSPTVTSELRKCCVPADAGQMLPLESTFLPLRRLKESIEKLNIDKFPFLIMPAALTDADENDWQFLKRFGVGFGNGSDELYFHIEALRIFATENQEECSPNALKALVKVYGAIERSCSSSEHVRHVCDQFKSHEMIYIPPTVARKAEWVKSEACVWTAPEWLETRRRLNGISKFADHKHLFRTILKINDADWKDYLDDLKMLKEQNRRDSEKVLDIYRRLWREFERDSNWETIRAAFKESDLVYAPSQNTWHSPTSCIWAGTKVRIPGKTSIQTSYESLEDLFCRILGVLRPDLKMHVQGLKQLAQSQPPPSESDIKQAMMLISSMDPTRTDVKDLQTANVFSVKLTNGQKSFTNPKADFAIVDRAEYGSAFAGKIRILDYSIEEVRACRSLLLALDLKNRHLSELVEENTTVQDSVVSPELSRTFRTKAYGVFRCAVHHQSPRTRNGDISLYDKLRRTSLYISDGISKSISVVQYGKTITVQRSRANFHLAEDDDKLRLYVPRDEDAREECFFRQLPRRLMNHFAIRDPTAEALLNGIVGCRSLVAVDGILKDAGIVEVEGIERNSELDHDSQSNHLNLSPRDGSAVSLDDVTTQSGGLSPLSNLGMIATALDEIDHAADPPHRRPSSDGRLPVPHRPTLTPRSRSPSSHSQTSVPSHAPPLSRSRSPSSDGQASVLSSLVPTPPERSAIPIPLVNGVHQETGYATLLERVINSAERMTIPAKGDCVIDNMQHTVFPGGVLFPSFFTTRSFDRDCKVGAAGELLIFEILVNMGLPGFSASNWKSTIRKEVRVHDKYRDLEPWSGFETADIIYTDSEGDLTKLLIDKGYLENETWENVRPTYYLEVKTTTRNYDEPFYMSDNQRQRMQYMQQLASMSVYVILRVFNLEGRIGLRVYVNPGASGEVQFTTDTWVVRPVRSMFLGRNRAAAVAN